MKYLILVLCVTGYVYAASQTRNVYCSKDKGEEKSAFGGGNAEIFCTHLELQKGDRLTLKNQTSANIAFAELIYVTGDVHETSLDLLPNVEFILILKSNITEFSLKSNIGHLDVTNSAFPKVTRELLKGSKHVITLGFMSNPGLEFEVDAFRDLKKLRVLVLINQTIPRLQRSFLEGPDRLQDLILNLNDLSVVDEDAFLGLSNLEQINLDDNPIKHFKANISGLTRLETLSLTNTNLKVLSVDVNVKRNQLDHLYLPTTYLLNTNISVVSSMVPKLHFVGVLSKDWECPAVKPVLEQLKLDGFRVTKVGESMYLKELVRPSAC